MRSRMSNEQTGVAVLPRFKNLDPDQFAPKIELAMTRYAETIAHVKAGENFTWNDSIQPLEESAENLQNSWSILSHLNSVANTPKIRSVYEDLLPKLTNFHTEVLQDVDLFRKFVDYRDSDEYASLSVGQKTIVKNEIRDFNLSGVDLSPEQRGIYRGYVESLTELENQYSNNVLDATEGWTLHVTPEKMTMLAGLPAHTLSYAKEQAESKKLTGWLLTLDYPCYHAIMSYASNRELREQFYRQYTTRASSGEWDNTPVIAEILKSRQEIAKIIGYKTYAQYSLIPKTAESVQEVHNFLDGIIAKVKGQARQEHSDLRAYAQNAGLHGDMNSWDFTFYQQLMLKENYGVSEEELRAYFPEHRVLTGLFKLARLLFGLMIEEVEDFDSWHESIRLFKIIDEKNELRGYFYIDLYTREGKEGGAWMSECTSRLKFANDFMQTPVAFLNCNFAPPVGSEPGLLSHQEVITLFHEFGHTIHHVLTTIDFFSVSGMNGVAWDAVELPSQFMENWCWEWLVIQDISENINTGEPLPRPLFDKLLASKNYMAATALSRQVEFSLFDLRIHEDPKISAHEILAKVREEVSVTVYPEYNRFETSFTHIFGGGYAAGYYSYLWAEVLSCDAFDKFKEDGLINPDLGRAFLKKILEQGGSRPAMDLFVDFAGRKPEVDALLKHHGIV